MSRTLSTNNRKFFRFHSNKQTNKQTNGRRCRCRFLSRLSHCKNAPKIPWFPSVGTHKHDSCLGPHTQINKHTDGDPLSSMRAVPSTNRGTQHLEPAPAQVFKPRFVPSRTKENDVTMWQNRHICTKFQENRHIVGRTKKRNFETRQRHIEPGMWCFVTKMWRHSFSSPSHTENQV